MAHLYCKKFCYRIIKMKIKRDIYMKNKELSVITFIPSTYFYIYKKKKNHIANISFVLSVIPQINDWGGIGGQVSRLNMTYYLTRYTA